MEIIILIETSASLCSVALSDGGKVIAYRESTEPRSHASLTAVFVDELLRENGLQPRDCAAVCVSEGPGSYTGLRVGVSTAKGLCFGSGLPLLAVGTPEILFRQALGSIPQKGSPEPDGWKYIVPLTDARRMEVYTATFSPDGKQLTETAPMIIDADSFAGLLEEGPVLFVGDAADKCRTVLTHPNAHFMQCSPEARAMAVPASIRYKEKRFEDVAYFEPFYLKEFTVTTEKKKLF